MNVRDASRTARLEQIRDQTLPAYAKRDWRKQPIVECGEPLVQVDPAICSPYYADKMGLTNDRRVFLRSRVHEALIYASGNLYEEGLVLVVYDGWRSVEVQENLFWHYMKAFTVANTEWASAFDSAIDTSQIRDVFCGLSKETQLQLKTINLNYVSWPSSDTTKPSPHATGGSVDVWLTDIHGHALDLGVPFDWMEENAGAFYHLSSDRKKFGGDDSAICNLRTKMIVAMVDAGFTAYGPEFWHFNLGNQMDSIVSDKTAVYSYIEP